MQGLSIFEARAQQTPFLIDSREDELNEVNLLTFKGNILRAQIITAKIQ
jgi:hypothetical protein